VALYSNNLIVGTNLEEVKQKSNLPESSDISNEDINKDHAILVVNGKNKKIGKKSQYLLDMLTLDDD